MRWTIEEEQELKRLVECSWDWIFPGWSQFAISLNRDFKNNRTSNACRQKYNKLISKSNNL